MRFTYNHIINICRDMSFTKQPYFACFFGTNIARYKECTFDAVYLAQHGIILDYKDDTVGVFTNPGNREDYLTLIELFSTLPKFEKK